MATSTKPLISAVSLASAAAIAAATPVIAPSVSSLSPHALSAAKVELATFADLLALTPADYVTAYFQGYGGFVGNLEYTGTPPNQTYIYDDPFADASWNIWFGSCAVANGEAGGCVADGLSGVAYQALDALVNGGTTNVGALNYYFEAGLSAGSTYLLQSSIGSANPILSTLITLIEAGPQLVTEIWNTAWSTAASLVNVIPLVGPYIAGGIYAYLGYGPDGAANGYMPGLSGVLNYVLDLISGAPTPYPTATPESATESAAATLAASAVAASASRAVQAAEPVAEQTADVASDNAAVQAARTADVAAPETEATGTEATGTEATAEVAQAAVEVEAPKVDATAPAPAPAVAAPAAGETTAAQAPAEEAAPAPAPQRKRPVRDAVEKVGKQISAALGGSKAKAAADAGGADTAPASAADAS